MKAQFLIAAANTGAGKTTLTLGLLRAFRRKGYSVQAFKCGPDFIDPLHHSTASGRDSINLDRFMMSDGHIRDLYHSYTADADIAITEGVMGLFDGALKSEGSAADLAKLLDLPVLLVLDANAMAYSAAAILYGLRRFDPAVRVAGVVFNFVESERHYRILQEAAVDAGVIALGYLPTTEALRIKSRHLGLDTIGAEAGIGAAADLVDRHLLLEEWLALTKTNTLPSEAPAIQEIKQAAATGKRNILIANDAAFQFLYPENVRRLAGLGLVRYFSPLRDKGFPEKPDLIYLPGGYPELYLPRLAANKALLFALRNYAETGGKILAECGGMMYLGTEITDGAGGSYPMAGILDIATTMQPKDVSIGYRSVPLPGGTARGHEFHFSRLTDGNAHHEMATAFTARAEEVSLPLFRTRQVLASYVHFYWGEDMSWLLHWLDS